MKAQSDTMRKKHRKTLSNGRSAEGKQYLGLPYNMAHSLAWRSLSGNAVKAWVELRCRYNGGNNGKLSIPYASTCRLLGIGRATLKRALEELQEKGFIRLIKKGGWYGRLASEWAVTDTSYDGHHPTNEWKNWRPTKRQKSEIGFDAEHV